MIKDLFYIFVKAYFKKRKKFYMSKFYITSIDGTKFYTDHYLKVRRYRESNGLPSMSDYMFSDNGKIVDHPLINREFEKNGERYVIESVNKQWYMGWYELAVARKFGTKSHGTFMIKSINCKYDIILEAVEENEREIKWI